MRGSAAENHLELPSAKSQFGGLSIKPLHANTKPHLAVDAALPLTHCQPRRRLLSVAGGAILDSANVSA